MDKFKTKEFLLGTGFGYLITSGFSLSFPGNYFWFFLFGVLIISSRLWISWKRLDGDFPDY